jgi:hypothetical protein
MTGRNKGNVTPWANYTPKIWLQKAKYKATIFWANQMWRMET